MKRLTLTLLLTFIISWPAAAEASRGGEVLALESYQGEILEISGFLEKDLKKDLLYGEIEVSKGEFIEVEEIQFIHFESSIGKIKTKSMKDFIKEARIPDDE